MFVICYTENNRQQYDTVNSMDEFNTKHPTAITNYVFTHTQSATYSLNFRTYASRYGLSPSDELRRFKNIRGENCTIIGIAPRNRKYPIIVHNEDQNKNFKYSAQAIQNFLSESAQSY